ncbi:Bug family tripartite tricarboxylate transporter substrate binding protein [Falsiroseomonas selenitidurans]|uniref:Tripartite tricarboxylate transporter substrate binding protein n=1 Tax=Falsiroseomonas selenitidurans TaxID=2716335 RepID=A0ABX1E3G7_9PROT|nr:tripartite tricarboxylate transporter substrate-binding protein [Falsiroseomonas selenitidurans]NKC31727.1 tripartite tricarboxylate transporter substrate binding protein [Falsiroseomonas selenitidurans]
MTTRRNTLLAAAGLAGLAAGPARAQAFPERPVRLVVGYPPGGNVDFTARLLQPAMSQALGQPVVVENRAGAGGIVGTDAVAKARPDGYTMLITGTAPVSIFPVAMERLPYDPLRDFAPIGMAYRVPIVLLVAKDITSRTLAEFVTRAKATPGGFSAGTAGTGSGAHLAIELFNAGTGAGLVHVPYRGTGPALNDLIAGNIPVMFDQLSSALQLHADGRARIIGIASAERSPLLPQVETLREAGMVEAELSTTLGLLAPAGTPAAVVEKLRAALAAALADATVAQRLGSLGAVIPPAANITPAYYGQVIRDELDIYRRAVRLGNVKLE